MITLSMWQLLVVAAFATLAGIGAAAVLQLAAEWLMKAYRYTLDKLSSARRWHEAYRSAVADLAHETNDHRVTRSALDQARAEIRALTAEIEGRRPQLPRIEPTSAKFLDDMAAKRRTETEPS